MSKTTFDVALVDIGLPGADGLALIRRLRAAGNALPVLVLTARNGMGRYRARTDAGADDYLACRSACPKCWHACAR